MFAVFVITCDKISFFETTPPRNAWKYSVVFLAKMEGLEVLLAPLKQISCDFPLGIQILRVELVGIPRRPIAIDQVRILVLTA